jgi:CRP-like cAMP-binding protein
MASRISCTREAVNREYNKLAKLGIIRRKPKILIIENVPGLQQLVDEALT